MRQADEEDEVRETLGDNAQEELPDERKNSLFYRISRQRAAYFADIRDCEGSEEELVDGVYNGGAGDLMGKVGVSGARQKPVNQSPQKSGFADLSTWYCDALAPPCAPVYSSARSHPPAQDERQLAAAVDQPTLLLPVLASGSMHIADMPTEPLLVVISRDKARGKKKPGVLARLCPGFLRAWLRRLKPGPRASQIPATKAEKPAKQAAIKGKKKQSTTSHKAQQQTMPKKEQQQAQGAGERVRLVENTKTKDRSKSGKKERQEAEGSSHKKQARVSKGSQILLERLREREQRGDMPRTLTPPVLRPARISRPPTDTLFGR